MINAVDKFDIGRFHHLKVKYVLDRPADDRLLHELLTIACAGKSDWNTGEWEILLNHIRSSELTVGEYLKEAASE